MLSLREPRQQSSAMTQALALIENLRTVIVGKDQVLHQAVAALLANGHILIEDVPGVGKTMLAKALSLSIAGRFARVQFTSDLFPSDITGMNVFRQHDGSFEFRPGPIFTNVLLADEINRATPRTQSSLLEAMEEQQISIEGQRHELLPPFLVIATQNPIELEGTYPLPFAQMDRFMVRLSLGYLESADELRMVMDRLHAVPLAGIKPVLDCQQLVALQQFTQGISIESSVVAYAVVLVRATRQAPTLLIGASPRASLDLVRYSQALAVLNGRDYVLPDDVKQAAPLVLSHRVVVRQGSRQATAVGTAVIDELVADIAVPL